MKWSVERSQKARADLIDIWTYIAEDNPDAADRQLDAIESVFELLRKHPRIGRSRDDIGDGLRGFSRGQYLILYQLDEPSELIRIVRVIHSMRDLANLFA